MIYSRQTLASVAQVLGSLTSDAVGILLYKHLDVKPEYYVGNMIGYLNLIESAKEEALRSLVAEIVRERDAVSVDAKAYDVFDGRWRELER